MTRNEVVFEQQESDATSLSN